MKIVECECETLNDSTSEKCYHCGKKLPKLEEEKEK